MVMVVVVMVSPEVAMETGMVLVVLLYVVLVQMVVIAGMVGRVGVLLESSRVVLLLLMVF